ncbi:MAG TPA: stage II sporulation protein D [Tenericutes bacterium]|nr:stage II sporulation protein D [Mycoplasmatota bacterium]
MKKIIFLTILMILIPYLIITLFVKEKEIKFEYVSNMSVRIKREMTGNIDIVPFEDYIVGVLAGEMPVSFEIEALKAQAVAARSYVMKKMEYNSSKEYDVVDTVNNQVYLDEKYLKQAWKDKYVENINKIKTAVLETKGQYLEYNGKVVEAFFFSTSVGATENSEEIFSAQVPYLRSVVSLWDKDVSPVYNDYFYFSLDEFYKKLGLEYSNKIITENIETTSTGRIKKIKINGSIFTGGQVFEKLKLRSTHFTITQNDNKVAVVTKGYGHGVGMSQYGAQGMAKSGYKYDEILKYYYQGVELKKI